MLPPEQGDREVRRPPSLEGDPAVALSESSPSSCSSSGPPGPAGHPRGRSGDDPPGAAVATYARCVEEPAGVESGDYDLHESPQYLGLLEAQEEALQRQALCPRTLGRAGRRWALVVLAGAGAGLVGAAIDQACRKLLELRLHIMDLLDGDEPMQYLAFLCFGLALVSIAATMVCFVEPLAAGSGIPEIKCFLNGTHLPRVLNVKTLLAKVCGIVGSVAAGMPAGKEGPMIHSGAIMGSLVARPFSDPLMMPKSFDRERRDLVAAGAAAGVAAAFSAPLGGVLFAIEEGASWMNVTIMLRTFVCALTAALVQRLLTGGFESGKWGHLGSGGYPLEFGHLSDLEYSLWDLPFMAVEAILFGLLGAAWNGMNMRLQRWRRATFGQTGPRRWAEAMLSALAIVSLNFWLSVWLQGPDDKGQAGVGAFFSSSQADVIQQLFTSDQPFDGTGLVVLAATHFLTGCWTFGLGIPCGIFLPTLLSGAALGRLFGQELLALGVISQKDLGGYALLGAAGLLAGVARITISLSVILMESVRNQTFALPLFMTTLVAKLVGSALNEGIYDMLIKLRKIPLMELGPEKHYIHLRARDVMATNLVTLQPVEEVHTLLAKLEGCRHNAFPVAEAATGSYLGLARRAMLERVLAAKSARGGGSIFQEAGRPLASPAPVVHFEGLRGRPAGLEEARAGLREAELQSRIDLRPFMNGTCYTVLEDASVTRCHELFRTMGLRHVPVVSRSGLLQGILTRKDLLMASGFLHAAGPHRGKAGAPAWPCAAAAGRSGTGGGEAGSAISV